MADLRPGDWVYFWNHKDYLAKHPGGAWSGENAINKGKDKGKDLFSGFGAKDLNEGQMNKKLLEAYNKGLPQSEQLSSAQWAAAKNSQGGSTGLDLSSAIRVDGAQVEAVLP